MHTIDDFMLAFMTVALKDTPLDLPKDKKEEQEERKGYEEALDAFRAMHTHPFTLPGRWRPSEISKELVAPSATDWRQ